MAMMTTMKTWMNCVGICCCWSDSLPSFQTKNICTPNCNLLSLCLWMPQCHHTHPSKHQNEHDEKNDIPSLISKEKRDSSTPHTPTHVWGLESELNDFVSIECFSHCNCSSAKERVPEQVMMMTTGCNQKQGTRECKEEQQLFRPLLPAIVEWCWCYLVKVSCWYSRDINEVGGALCCCCWWWWWYWWWIREENNSLDPKNRSVSQPNNSAQNNHITHLVGRFVVWFGCFFHHHNHARKAMIRSMPRPSPLDNQPPNQMHTAQNTPLHMK